MFEIIICDDDDACLEQTCQLVNDWKAAISTPISVKTMESGDKLLEYCAKNSPDVILLDIMMPLLNGMDAARELREHNLISKIIFLTTSPEFAIESYDVDASGYLLKPVDRERSYISFWTNVYLLCQSLPIPSQYILHLDIKMYSCTILSFLKRKIRRSYWHYMTEKT